MDAVQAQDIRLDAPPAFCTNFDADDFVPYRDMVLVLDTLLGIRILPVVGDTVRFDAPRYLRVLGVTSLEVEGGDVLRVSNFRDEVRLSLPTPDSLLLLGRVADRRAFPNIYPCGSATAYFECYDADRGFFGGWQRDTLDAPSCLTRF